MHWQFRLLDLLEKAFAAQICTRWRTIGESQVLECDFRLGVVGHLGVELEIIVIVIL